jgi:outer membrane protein
MKMKSTVFFTTASAMLFLSSHVTADTPISDAYSPGESDSLWIVGGTILSWDNPYINDGDDDNEYDGTFSPRVEYRGERFFVDTDGLGLTLYRLDGLSLGVVLSGEDGYLSDEDRFEDNERLSGIEERDVTATLGGYVLHNHGDGQFRLTVSQEITGEHDGQSVDARYVYNFPVGNWDITPSIGLSWASEDTVNHFYGVSERESLAATNIASYEGDSSFSGYGGVSARYEFTEHWDVQFGAGFVAYGEGIKDSPLIEDSSTFVTGLGVNYNF